MIVDIKNYIDSELGMLNDRIGQIRESEYDIDTKITIIQGLVGESNALLKLKMFIQNVE